MEQTGHKLKNTLMGVTVFLLLLACAVVLRGYFRGSFDSVESFQAYIGAFGALGPLVLTLIQAIQVVIPVLPGFLGSIVGTGMFGPAVSFWCNYIGISAGSIAAFLLARYYGVALVRQLIPMERYRRFAHWVNSKKSYTVVLALCILLPLFPDDYLCYLSGLMEMPAKRFVWIIVLAKPWCILAYCLFFAQMI